MSGSHTVTFTLDAVATVGSGSEGIGRAERLALGLDQSSHIIAFGGGRGITAQVVKSIARNVGCSFSLCGSTPRPNDSKAPDPDSGVSANELRRKLAEKGIRSPKDIEREVRCIKAQNEILQTLQDLKEADCQAEYTQVDVRTAESVNAFITENVEKYGSPNLLIYGSGLTRDHLFVDASLQDLALVEAVKCQGLKTTLAVLSGLQAAPKLLVAFGSIASMTGNRGQAVYSAANDEVECIVDQWSVEHPDDRSVTLHWGAWAPDPKHPGMVSEELAREFERRKITLLNPLQAVDCVLQELAWGDGHTAVAYANADWLK